MVTDINRTHQAERIARIAHEVNRTYCSAIGDMSQVAWEDAEPWQKTSALAGVVFVQEDPTATPEDCHESWREQKAAEGWVYGPVKDAEKKEHPCMVPYNELSVEQRVKDHLFRTIVKLLSE